MYNVEEKHFQCPYCGETISMILETEYGEQSYIEDCQVCCQPIQISYEVQNGEIQQVFAECAQ